MASIVLEPIIITDALLKLGTTNTYERHVSSAILVPTTPKVRWRGIGGGDTLVSGRPTWVLNLNLAQDWETANSLSTYLSENAGDIVAFELTPRSGGDKWTESILAEVVQIGGNADAMAEATAALDVVGQPVRVPAV
jgi:hypothetical protein